MTTSFRRLAWSIPALIVASVFALSAASGRARTSAQVSAQTPTAAPPPGAASANPDPPCFDNTHRYVDCGNGTVTDTFTGLIWLRNAGCLEPLTWAEANQAAASLQEGFCGLEDGSRVGDWRLPSNAEWSTMVDAAVHHPQLRCTNPALTDDAGSACFGDGSSSSFLNVQSTDYWSSTTNSQASGLLPDGSKAGSMSLSNGFLPTYVDKGCCPLRAWPVRAH